MGRTPKEKLDYYSMDDGWIHDYKVRRFVRKAGFEGLGFYNYLLHEIYHQSYYIEYNEDFIFSAAEYGNVDEEQIIEWVKQMESVGLVKIIEVDGTEIITSKGIQKRYLFIRNSLRRAQEFVPDTELWLLKLDENIISATKTMQKSDFGHENDAEIEFLQTERKGKEKGKEKKKETKKETETKTETEVRSVESDFDVPSYNPVAERINKILENEIQMGYREYTFIAACADYFDERALEEAVMKAIKVKRDGKLRGNLLKYVEGTLRNWENGNGMPDYAKDEEARIAEQKAEYMRPGKFQEVFVDG